MNARGRRIPVIALCALVLTFAQVALGAQDAAVIIYAEGDSITVVASTGRQTVVQAVDAVGYQIRIGDTVATEHGTFVELQLLPSDSILKIAENTNFTIERRDTPRGGTFSLVYGKVRARVAVLTQKEEFVIKSGGAIAGVRGTDFGVTVMVPGYEAASPREAAEIDDTLAVTQVYCFDGAVEVVVLPPLSAPETPQRPAVIVRENEVVTVEPEANEAPVVEAIPEDIRAYWDANDFKAEPLPVSEEMRGAAPGPAAGEAGAAAQPPAVEAEPQPQPGAAAVEPRVGEAAASVVVTPEELVRRAEKGRFSFRAISVLMFAVGGAFEVAGLADLLIPGADFFGDNGVGMIGVGGVFLLGGIFSTFQAAKLGQTVEELKQRQAP